MKVTGSIQQRYGIYQMMVRIINENGKPTQKIKSTKITIEGKNKRESDANKKRAEKMLAKWMAELEAQTSLPAGRKLVDAIDEWYRRYKDQVRLNTWEAAGLYIDLHLKPYFEPLDLNIENATTRHVQQYIDMKYKEGLVPGSIKKHMTVLNGVFKEAVAFQEIPTNPCIGVKYPKAKKFTPKFYTAAESVRLIKALEGDPIKPAVMIGLYLGLRRSEVAGLRWSDVDFLNNTLVVRNTVVRFKTVLEEEHTKSEASKRTLALPNGLRLYFLELRKEQEENRMLCGADYHDSGHICQWPNGRAYDPSFISARFQKCLKKNDLPVIRFHDLRHTAGSLLFNDGYSAKEVQEFLGHEDVSTTLNIYVHTFSESKRIAATKMDTLLGQ